MTKRVFIFREDVIHYQRAGVQAVLVGESLMRATNPINKIKELKGQLPTIVKVETLFVLEIWFSYTHIIP